VPWSAIRRSAPPGRIRQRLFLYIVGLVIIPHENKGQVLKSTNKLLVKFSFVYLEDLSIVNYGAELNVINLITAVLFNFASLFCIVQS